MFDSAIVVGDSDFVSLFNDVKHGGHVVAFAKPTGYARMAVRLEDAGFEVRDSLHVAIGAGTSGQVPNHMLAVLARKPLIGTVAANVLTHGTGALNIDGCRIAATADDFAKLSAGVESIRERGGTMDNSWKNSSDLSGANPANPAGRWPANTLFVHAAGCEHVGSTEDTFGGGKEATSGFVNGYAHDGFVGTTVQSAVWECVDGCPVAGLDSQSGQVKGGTWNRTKGARHFNNDGEATDYETSGSDKSVGGASRYFMNLTWSPKDTGLLPASLLDYVERLITPVGGSVFRNV